jgi:hypothetical protein
VTYSVESEDQDEVVEDDEAGRDSTETLETISSCVTGERTSAHITSLGDGNGDDDELLILIPKTWRELTRRGNCGTGG